MRAFNDLYVPPPVVDTDAAKDLPATALYDFCNAFPTLLHEWLFLLLKVLQLPEQYWWIIWWFYQNVTAYSSGTGDGSFLFRVQAGVKTGCPLSSLLFLLGVNPVIDLFLRLSDGPKLSATRVCADDFGSALRHLRMLKVHASIFALAAKTTGLLLKPEKCVIVISLRKLTPAFVMLIREWLRINVPDFANFIIADSGKYLGWYLGRNSVELSFSSPFSKFASRVKGVFDGNAPAVSVH